MTPNVLLRWILGPLGFANFLTPVALLTLGLGAWTFFRQMRLTPLAATLGALAAMLNSTFFSGACWGVATQEIGVGMVFFAMALVASIQPAMSPLQRWTRVALAGMAVGINVMESADIGALFSLLVAAFVVYHAGTATEGAAVKRLARGVGRVILIAVCAAFIAAYALTGLIGTQIKGIARTAQDEQTKQQNWDWATQWSLHKRETLGLVVPGLFGYRMDTPDGGTYWGAMGRDPIWERYFQNGSQGQPPQALLRFSGGGNYTGVLVTLVAIWAALQSFRKQNSVFSALERKLLWFWAAGLVISLLLAFGRFAPFYQFIYALPYFSTMRNPTKFLAFVSFASVVLFAYGIHGLNRRYVEVPLVNTPNLSARLKGWWVKACAFDKRWTVGCLAAVGASLLGWLVYSSSRQSLVRYLETVQVDGDLAKIASFSIQQVGWFILFLAAGVVLITLLLSGSLAGPRAKWAGMLLGLVLVADLGRANLPWIIYWNYPEKYETSGPNPVVQFLAQKPYEHRVALLPEWILSAFQLPQDIAAAEGKLNGVYTIEWNQQLFPYYNIQTLNIIQRPRTPEDIDAFEKALAVRSAGTLRNQGRLWELTNTRYVIGFVGFVDLLNAQFDPGRGRFRVAERFDIVPKPGINRITRWQDYTAVQSSNGIYAVFEFTGALPRAKLYSRWGMPADDPVALEELRRAQLETNSLAFLQRIGTNDFLTLQGLSSPAFDPAQIVMVASRVPASTNAVSGGSNPGTVEFSSYASKHIKLRATAAEPAILLLNDKYDPNWQVRVDGKPAELLRCNFIMRGVYLPPGPHTVEFLFTPPIGALYISLAAIVVAVGLLGSLIVSKEEQPLEEHVTRK